jgi:hypothetical protein
MESRITITPSRQEFRADVIQRYTERDSRLLWFSTDPTAAPPQACLLVTANRRPSSSSSESNFTVELNGQENFRTGPAIETIDASPRILKLRFRRGNGIHPGYVDASRGRIIRELAVRFHLAPRNAAYLKALVEIARYDGCRVRFRSAHGQAPPIPFTPIATVRP